MQTALLEKLGNSSLNQCTCVGATVSAGYSLGSGLAVVLEAWKHYEIPGYESFVSKNMNLWNAVSATMLLMWEYCQLGKLGLWSPFHRL